MHRREASLTVGFANTLRQRCRVRKCIVAIGIPVGVLALSAVPAYAVATCPTTGINWYGRASAPTNSGTSNGDYIQEAMPASYYAASGAATDEAVWSINMVWANKNMKEHDYQYNGAFELGWFMGEWPYASSYTFYHNPHGYYTIWDGVAGVIPNDSDIPDHDVMRFRLGYTNTACPILLIYDVTTTVNYWAITSCPASYNPIIPTPREDISQGEVADATGSPQGTWMGGNSGSGVRSTAWYQSYSNDDYYPWGSYSMCDNSPYWIQAINSTNEWKNGGK